MNLLIKITLFVIFLSGCSQHSLKKPLESKQVAVGCSIYDLNGNLLRRYSGNLCFFEVDGHVLINHKNQNLTYYDSQMRTLWRLVIHSHHQINQAANGDFLIISSEAKEFNKKITRFDRFVRINKKGQVIGDFSFAKVSDQFLSGELFPEKVVSKFDWDQDNSDIAEVEVTHANSIYEIPFNTNTDPAFQQGNIITSVSKWPAIFIFDPKLQRIIKRINIQGARRHHDAQVLPNGNLLLYVNEQTLIKSISSILMELNLTSQQQAMFYNGTKENKFYSSVGGGIQKINDNLYFFSDLAEGKPHATFINKKGDILKNLFLKGLTDTQYIQQAKILDLNNFLISNIGQ